MASPAPSSSADVKKEAGIARDSRMTLRKNNEEVLRKALQAEARKKCAVETKAFGDCAKASGLSVIISCRKENLVSVCRLAFRLLSLFSSDNDD